MPRTPHLVIALLVAGLSGQGVYGFAQESAARTAPQQAEATTAAPSAPDPPLPAAIRRVLAHPTLAGAEVGLLAVDADTSGVLFARNAEQEFAPASVTKLFTTAAALWKLGGHYVWRTPIAYHGTRDPETVHGNVWILGRGAPDLVEERLWVTARWLSDSGLTTIDGDIVVDDRYLGGDRYGVGWPGGRQVTEAYHAPVTALMANYAAQRVNNEWASVEDPPLHFGARLAEALELAGIRITGGVRRPTADELTIVPAPTFRGTDTGRTTVPRPLVALHDIQSEPLGRLVMDVNKFSNNVMSEVVLRALGAMEYGAPGTDSKGRDVVSTFLREQLGFTADSYLQADGSGLSRQNRFRPAQVVSLLQYAHKDFHLGPELLASLKISGLDGWSPAPFKYAPLRGELRVKSGHIRGVNTLAGFLHTGSDRLIVFAFMVNNHRAQQWEIDQRMAELTEVLIRDY